MIYLFILFLRAPVGGGGSGVSTVCLTLAPTATTTATATATPATPTSATVLHAAGGTLHVRTFRSGDVDGLHATILALLNRKLDGLLLLREMGVKRMLSFVVCVSEFYVHV